MTAMFVAVGILVLALLTLLLWFVPQQLSRQATSVAVETTEWIVLQSLKLDRLTIRRREDWNVIELVGPNQLSNHRHAGSSRLNRWNSTGTARRR